MPALLPPNLYHKATNPMLRFLSSTLYLAILLPFYLQWSGKQVEGQIDKMQEAAFNTPGAEAPITPAVVVGGITLVTSHIVIARRVLGLSNFAAFLSLLLGGALGFIGWRYRNMG